MIRVGRIKNCNDKLSYTGFLPIVVMTKSSKYGSLGPYVLKDTGKIMENIWQFSKVYQKVPKSKQYYSRWNRTVIWDHPAETHVNSKGEITQAYLDWRGKGMSAEHPIRYPVGSGKHKGKCLYALKDTPKLFNAPLPLEKLDYIDARKVIYLSVYAKLVRDEPQYKYLLELLSSNINLLILEVDGPHQESLDYYRKNYTVDDDFISNGSMDCIPNNLKIMINDTKHNFGHGYCLAWCLYEDHHGIKIV